MTQLRGPGQNRLKNLVGGAHGRGTGWAYVSRGGVRFTKLVGIWLSPENSQVQPWLWEGGQALTRREYQA